MNETEREILELAAKAVGLKVIYTEPSLITGTVFQCFIDNDHQINWNPLLDDGDAVQLATKLCSEGKMRVQISEQYVACYFLYNGVFVPYAWDYDGIEPQEAFRKCVTHTAAEIGRNMK